MAGRGGMHEAVGQHAWLLAGLGKSTVPYG